MATFVIGGVASVASCVTCVCCFFCLMGICKKYHRHRTEARNIASPASQTNQQRDEIWSITGNTLPEDIRRDGFLSDQVTITNELDKPPSYNEDPPTYEQAIKMARATSDVQTTHDATDSSQEDPKPAH